MKIKIKTRYGANADERESAFPIKFQQSSADLDNNIRNGAPTETSG